MAKFQNLILVLTWKHTYRACVINYTYIIINLILDYYINTSLVETMSSTSGMCGCPTALRTDFWSGYFLMTLPVPSPIFCFVSRKKLVVAKRLEDFTLDIGSLAELGLSLPIYINTQYMYYSTCCSYTCIFL